MSFVKLAVPPTELLINLTSMGRRASKDTFKRPEINKEVLTL